jgi:CheY-specific phosphatase CheX
MPRNFKTPQKPNRPVEPTRSRKTSGIAGFGGAQNARWSLRIEPSLSQTGLPGDEWPARLENAAREVLSAIASPRTPGIVRNQDDSCAEVVATVGMAGALWAELTVNCSPLAARRIACRMFGLPCPSGEQVALAVGEVATRIARRIRTLYVHPADGCLISPPASLASPHSREGSADEGRGFLTAVGFEDLPVWIRLSLHT